MLQVRNLCLRALQVAEGGSQPLLRREMIAPALIVPEVVAGPGGQAQPAQQPRRILRHALQNRRLHQHPPAGKVRQAADPQPQRRELRRHRRNQHENQPPQITPGGQAHNDENHRQHRQQRRQHDPRVPDVQPRNAPVGLLQGDGRRAVRAGLHGLLHRGHGLGGLLCHRLHRLHGLGVLLLHRLHRLHGLGVLLLHRLHGLGILLLHGRSILLLRLRIGRLAGLLRLLRRGCGLLPGHGIALHRLQGVLHGLGRITHGSLLLACGQYP